MRKVADVLVRKGNSALAVHPSETVMQALKLMSDKNIGSVIVKDEKGIFLGIVTERDYSRKVVLHGRSSTETLVRDIMSTDLPKVSPHDTVEHCMELMTDKYVRYLPVFSGDDLIGIISMSDVVKETILAQQETIDHLKHYITL